MPSLRHENVPVKVRSLSSTAKIPDVLLYYLVNLPGLQSLVHNHPKPEINWVLIRLVNSTSPLPVQKNKGGGREEERGFPWRLNLSQSQKVTEMNPVNLDPDSSRKNRIPTGSSVDLKDAQDIQHEPTPSPEQ